MSFFAARPHLALLELEKRRLRGRNIFTFPHVAFGTGWRVAPCGEQHLYYLYADTRQHYLSTVHRLTALDLRVEWTRPGMEVCL